MNAAGNWLAPVLRNRMVMFVLALAVLVPLAFTPVSFRNPALGAGLLEGCAIVLLAMLLRADWRGGMLQRVGDFCKSAVNLPVLLFLAVAGASVLMAPDWRAGVQEFLRLGSGVIIYFAIAHHIRRSDQLSCLVDVVLFLCCAISIAGFVQFSSGAGVYATGLFGDHQLYGSVLMALLPVAAAVAVSEKSPGRQLFARGATVLTAAGLLIAGSRGAWIGGATALILLVVFSLVQLVKKHRSHVHMKVSEVVVPVVLLAMATGFFLYLWPQASTILGRATTFKAVTTSASGDKCCSAGKTHLTADATWNGRQLAWAGAEKMIAQSPWTGKGLGSYASLQHNYSGQGMDIATLHLRPSLGEQAHNLYLQTAAEIGIPGLLIFLSIPLTLLYFGVRRAMQMDDGIRKTLLLGAMAAVVGVLVDALSSPSWQMGNVSVFMWLLMGIVASCMQPNAKRERSASLELAKQPASRPVFAFAALGLSVLLPTAAVAAAPVYMRLAQCRISPNDSLLGPRQSRRFQFFGTFADENGNLGQEVDLTTNPGTIFTFITNIGIQPEYISGQLSGPNNSIYYAPIFIDESFHVTVTATFKDGFGTTCFSEATIGVFDPNGGASTFDTTGKESTALTIILPLSLALALTHHSTSDNIDFDAGQDNNQTGGARLDTDLEGYGRALPDDSLFNTGKPAGKIEAGKTGK